MALIEFKNVSKQFPGVRALDAVSFSVEAGSCHALMGENGAGKSTLGKILAGIYRVDSGEVLLENHPIAPGNPLEARNLGIAMVHQELAFCPNLTVAENLCLGAIPSRLGLVERSRMRAQAKSMLAAIESDLNVDLPIEDLTTGQEQLVQIAAALGTNARIIVMDEPTSSLSAVESKHLFDLLGRLKGKGITIIYVSHRMSEIFQLCDTLTVLRDGRHVTTAPVADFTPGTVIQQMIGRELSVFDPRHVVRETGAEMLQVENLTSPGKFKRINFSLRAGEILGFAGLVGAGRSEVAQAIFGLDPAASGKVTAGGRLLQLGDVHDALRNSVGLLPEDRKRQGLVLSMNCRENGSLPSLKSVSFLGVVNSSRERRLVEEFSERLRVKTPSWEDPISGLSGGNQQKIALLKWLATRCKILIVDEPTRGVDVGAKREIHQILDELACQGFAILLISSELPEVMSLSRRMIVMREGEMAGELDRSEFTEERIMKLMAGVS